MKKLIKSFVIVLLIIGCGVFIQQRILRYINENRTLKEVITRLEADSRIAEVLVTGVNFDEKAGKKMTTIKFLEYGAKGEPLEPKYFTFPGNIIQFQSLVIRFDDFYVKKNHPFKGKSAYLFWKVFLLDGANTREFEITKLKQIPQGYRTGRADSLFEERLWERFWGYALSPEEAKKVGIKNAQIEAPGAMFVPGTLYTIKIEHDGGMRIDARSLPSILRGEKVL
ncbi:MAG TPA: hypothetical protein DCL35_07055 [Candidatus Omnitrophica bacterium]|nr:hypothetical protein [Candidatus Omnitrophota bacterium]